MKSGFIVITSLIVLVLLIVFGFFMTAPEVEKDLLDRSKKTLSDSEITFENIEFDGQQAILKGTIGSQKEKDQIEKIISAVPGVAGISNYLLVEVPVAVILKVTGENTIFNAKSGKSVKAQNGGRLIDGDIISTGDNAGRVELKFLDDNSLVRIRPNSSITINAAKVQNSVTKNILLEFGSILAKIVKQQASFKVTTSTSVAAVKGTSFWTLQELKGATSFLGEEGVVEISNDAGAVLMKAGEMCSVLSKTATLIVEKVDLKKAFIKTVGGNRITFGQNGTSLDKEKSIFLNKVKDFMLKYPTALLVIEGYTDSMGKAKENLLLSELRANAVKEYLVKEGVDPESLFVKAFGEKNPISDNYSRAGRTKNRRVEFIVKENK